MSSYLKWNVNRIFKDKNRIYSKNETIEDNKDLKIHFSFLSETLWDAEKPVLLIGSQALQIPSQGEALADAVKELNIPTYV